MADAFDLVAFRYKTASRLFLMLAGLHDPSSEMVAKAVGFTDELIAALATPRLEAPAVMPTLPTYAPDSASIRLLSEIDEAT